MEMVDVSSEYCFTALHRGPVGEPATDSLAGTI